MDSSKIKAIIAAILAVFAALYLGITAATAQFETIAWVLGVVSVSICLLLGARVYLLIPLLTSLALVLPLPGMFASGFISQAVFIAFATPLFLLRRLPMRIRFTELEFWMLLLFASVAQAYLRNPVGLDIFGSDTVGAKPYAVFAMSTICAAVLSTLVINPKGLKTWTYLTMIGSIGNFIIGAVGFVVPAIGHYLGASYTADRGGSDKVYSGASRITFIRSLSHHLALWVSSRRSPLTACFHPKWLPLVLFSMALAALSGYRAQLLLVGMTFFVGVCYRGGIKSVIASSMLGTLILFMLIIVNMVAPLPLNIQRTLTVLPGTWDQSVMVESQQSSDWRVEMWIEALTTDRWIHNKILGDGLGFTKEEYDRMLVYDTTAKANSASRVGLTNQQESFLINGSYHSGPVQTIRTTGYLGLAIMLMAMIRLAVHAHRQIKRCKDTEWYSTALFLGIPLIVSPIIWTLVFGTFDEGAVGVMMGIAIVRLMEQNLPLPADAVRRKLPVGLPSRATVRA